MRSSMNRWLVAVPGGLLGGYALSTRWLGLFGEPRGNQLLLLALTAPLCALLAAQLPPLAQQTPARLRWQLLAAAALLGGLIFALLPYRPADFPGPHTLEVRLNCAANAGSAELRRLERVSLPSGQPVPLTPAEVSLQNWQPHAGGYRAACPTQAALRFDGTFQGGVDLTFSALPSAGLTIAWDGRSLAAPAAGQTLSLRGSPPFAALGPLWKLRIAAAAAAEYLLLAALLWAGLLLAWQARTRPRGAVALALLLGAGILTNLLLIPTLERSSVYALRRLPDGRLSTLDEYSYDKKDNLPVYLYLLEHHPNAVLDVPPGLLDALALDARGMTAWARLSAVQTVNYPAELSEAQAAALQTLPQDVLPPRSGLRFTAVFLSTHARAAAAHLCVQRLAETVYFGPADLLPGCAGRAGGAAPALPPTTPFNQTGFLLALYLLGALAALRIGPRLPLSFIVFSAFLWGALGYVLAGMLALFVFGRYHAAGMQTAGIAALALLLAAHFLPRGRRTALNARALAALLAGGAAFAVWVTAAQHFNFAVATRDSFTQILLGRALAYPAVALDSASIGLGTQGIWLPMLQSAVVFLTPSPQGYLSALSPALAFALLGSFAALCRALTGRWRWGVLGALLLAATDFILFQSFYLHTSFAGAAYLTAALLTGWLAVQQQERSWLAFTAAGLIGFSLTRTESPLFSALFTALLVLSAPPAAAANLRLHRLGLAALLPISLWYVRLAALTTAQARFLAPGRALLLAAGLAGLALGLAFVLPRLAPRWSMRLPRLGLAALAAITLLAFALRPAHMAESLGVMLRNLAWDGRWGITWWLVLALLLLGTRRARWRVLQPGPLFTVGLPAFFLLMLAMAFLRTPYHLYWWDSANRMATQVLPAALACALALLAPPAANIAPNQGDPANG